jgi:hypothetical protein
VSVGGGLIASILRRLDRLEQQLAAAQGGEQLAPNYLTLTPGGLVGADFSGSVFAQVLQLQTGEQGAPNPGNALQWLTQQGGAEQAQIYAVTDGTNIFLSVDVGAVKGIVILKSDGTSEFIRSNPPGPQVVNGALTVAQTLTASENIECVGTLYGTHGASGQGLQFIELAGNLVYCNWNGTTLQWYVNGNPVSVA